MGRLVDVTYRRETAAPALVAMRLRIDSGASARTNPIVTYHAVRMLVTATSAVAVLSFRKVTWVGNHIGYTSESQWYVCATDNFRSGHLANVFMMSSAHVSIWPLIVAIWGPGLCSLIAMLKCVTASR